MQRMLVVVFETESKAYDGRAAMRELEMEGSIAVYAGAVLTKHADGTVTVRQYDELLPVGTLTGTSVGSLIGLLGGPVGVAVGAASGMVLGALVDFDNALVGEDFVAEVSQTLAPGKVALLAEVDEEWTTPLDSRMEALGGTVLRRSLLEFQQTQQNKEIAAMEADLAQLEEEMAKAEADERARLQAKVSALRARIDAQQKKAKERLAAFEERRKTKHELLKKNAANVGRAVKDLAKGL